MSFDLSSGCPSAEPHFGLRLTVSASKHPTRLVGHLRDETFALGAYLSTYTQSSATPDSVCG